MKKPVYTKEQVAILASNPYTRDVNEHRLSFTVEFKQYILEERERTGKTWKEIFRSAGYDPEIIGRTRMDAIVGAVRKQAASPQGLRAPSGRPQKKASEKEHLRTSVRELREEVEILNQKIEFLKKTLAIYQKQGPQK
ncbi:MAG: hypothetical protein IK087_07070 [Lachnospiraceae bacterium]|nr:hypothetical protein [Lachnospiraceae bacterium]MCR5160410.1 hypothetical protein [Lachnospiraceae bacterium]